MPWIWHTSPVSDQRTCSRCGSQTFGTPSAKREAIRIMTEGHGLPIVRACQAARLSRAAYYKPAIDHVAKDAELIGALQAIVVEEQRWGFWKCHDRLRAQGYGWNHKRTWRVYCQLRLNLPRRTKRRVPQRERQPLTVEPRMNAVWALDFMRDTLYSGKVFRTLNVIDEANRGALGIDVAVSIPASRVIAFMTQMLDQHGRPRAIPLRQRLRAHEPGIHRLVQGTGHRAAFHPAGQAGPERLHRALQPDLS